MINIEKLFFDYPDKKMVIDSLTLKVRDGECLGIIGPNGAGKTTLFHLLCGILRPRAGVIRIKGKEVVPGTFNPDIGLVFQYPDDQLFNTTVFDDVAFGPLNLGLDKREAALRVQQSLEETGTLALKERPPHHLSGGEKRMVAIASVLAMQPEIMIYDEPTSNLDMRARRNLISFIGRSAETVLIASHDMEFILETCSSVIVLDSGKIVARGPAADVMNDSDFMLEHGLERPHSLLHKGDHRHENHK